MNKSVLLYLPEPGGMRCLQRITKGENLAAYLAGIDWMRFVSAGGRVVFEIYGPRYQSMSARSKEEANKFASMLQEEEEQAACLRLKESMPWEHDHSAEDAL